MRLRGNDSRISAGVYPRGNAGISRAQIETCDLLLLIATAALLIGVFCLSTASRSSIGIEAGSHLRSLARAHKIAEGDGQAAEFVSAAVCAIVLLLDPFATHALLPIDNGLGKAVTVAIASRISRAPPAPA